MREIDVGPLLNYEGGLLQNFIRFFILLISFFVLVLIKHSLIINH